MALYRVLHRSGDEAPDDKGIGIYSSRARAKAAIRRVRGKPGFRDWLRIPTQTSRRFRSIPAGDSDGSQPLIPTHSSHP